MKAKARSLEEIRDVDDDPWIKMVVQHARNLYKAVNGEDSDDTEEYDMKNIVLTSNVVRGVANDTYGGGVESKESAAYCVDAHNTVDDESNLDGQSDKTGYQQPLATEKADDGGNIDKMSNVLRNEESSVHTPICGENSTLSTICGQKEGDGSRDDVQGEHRSTYDSMQAAVSESRLGRPAEGTTASSAISVSELTSCIVEEGMAISSATSVADDKSGTKNGTGQNDVNSDYHGVTVVNGSCNSDTGCEGQEAIRFTARARERRCRSKSQGCQYVPADTSVTNQRDDAAQEATSGSKTPEQGFVDILGSEYRDCIVGFVHDELRTPAHHSQTLTQVTTSYLSWLSSHLRVTIGKKHISQMDLFIELHKAMDRHIKLGVRHLKTLRRLTRRKQRQKSLHSQHL